MRISGGERPKTRGTTPQSSFLYLWHLVPAWLRAWAQRALDEGTCTPASLKEGQPSCSGGNTLPPPHNRALGIGGGERTPGDRIGHAAVTTTHSPAPQRDRCWQEEPLKADIVSPSGPQGFPLACSSRHLVSAPVPQRNESSLHLPDLPLLVRFQTPIRFLWVLLPGI